MKLSKKYISYGVVLAGAVGAYVYDQSSGPAKAPAAPAAVAPAPAESAKTPATAAKITQADTEAMSQLAVRLKKFAAAPLATSHNPFAAPASWVPPVAVAPQNEPNAQVTAKVDAFRQAHQLKVTFARGSKSMALIDDRLVKLGDTLDGLRLLRVDGTSATFSDASGHIVQLTVVAIPNND